MRGGGLYLRYSYPEQLSQVDTDEARRDFKKELERVALFQRGLLMDLAELSPISGVLQFISND